MSDYGPHSHYSVIQTQSYLVLNADAEPILTGFQRMITHVSADFREEFLFLNVLAHVRLQAHTV